MVVALLTAAGTASRMKQDIPKQFIHLHDKPIIIYTMERFQASPQVDAIAVATLPNWKEFILMYAKQFNITKLKWVCDGGATGQETIKKGLLEIAKDSDISETTVIVHDGNRPMVNGEIISDGLAVYRKHGSSVAAIPCTEAVFKSVDGHDSEENIPREMLFRTQTPHTYPLDKLLWAHEQAEKKNIQNTAATCTLMNALGEKVYFSKGSEKNIKITTTEDLEIFDALLNGEKMKWLK